MRALCIRPAVEAEIPEAFALRDLYLAKNQGVYTKEPPASVWIVCLQGDEMVASACVVPMGAGMIVHGIYGSIGTKGKRGVGALINSFPVGTASVVPASNEPLLGAITKRGWAVTSVIVERVA